MSALPDAVRDDSYCRLGFSPDPLASLTPHNLHVTYAGLRQEAPVHWSASLSGWVLTRHSDAITVLSDPAFLADDPVARFDRLEQRGGPALPNFRAFLSNAAFFTNPPRHAQLRRFLSRIFQNSDLVTLRVVLERRVEEILSDARRTGGLDLTAEFGQDLAVFTISVLLNLPLDGCHSLAATARDVAWIFDLKPRSVRDLRAADTNAGVLLDYFEAEIGRGRRRGDADRFARLVANADRELGMSDRDLAGLLIFVFVAGQETTASGIPAASVMLLRDGDLRDRLAAQPAKIPAAARELLRLAAPIQYVARIASRDSEIGGKAVRAGDRVNIILAAACRDPAVFPDPDGINIGREGPGSLAFGHGAYRCLGAAVAQMETEVALAALLANPDLRLVPGSVAWESRTRVPSMTHAWAEFA